MKSFDKKDQTSLLEGDLVLDALREGAQRELRIHKALGNPIATFESGKIVIVPPEEIQLGNSHDGANGKA